MIAIWGGSYAVVKTALDSLSPFAVIALRFWIAVLCLLPFLRAGLFADLRRTRGPGLAAGLVLALGYVLQTAGMRETSASMGGFLAGIIVLLVGIGGFLFLGAPIGIRSAVGLLLGLCGMLMLCWPSGDPGQQDTLAGILLQVGSSASYAAHILLLSRYGRGLPTTAFCLWQLLFVAAAGTLVSAVDGSLGATPGVPVDWTGGLLLALAYLGVLATALGIGVQSRVQHHIAPMHVALLFALQPLFAAGIGWAALDDRMTALQLAGGATIVAGVVVTGMERAHRVRPVAAEPAVTQ
jgi:drug/metabolite transporter (DMT)-like permease